MDKKPKYRIVVEYMGFDAWTIPPQYDRKDGGKFTLNEKLSQTDMGYLFEVIGFPGIEVAE